jgi:hypothetical protein
VSKLGLLLLGILMSCSDTTLETNNTKAFFTLGSCYEDMENFDRFKVIKMNSVAIFRELYYPEGEQYRAPALSFEIIHTLDMKFREIDCNE